MCGSTGSSGLPRGELPASSQGGIGKDALRPACLCDSCCKEGNPAAALAGAGKALGHGRAGFLCQNRLQSAQGRASLSSPAAKKHPCPNIIPSGPLLMEMAASAVPSHPAGVVWDGAHPGGKGWFHLGSESAFPFGSSSIILMELLLII